MAPANPFLTSFSPAVQTEVESGLAAARRSPRVVAAVDADGTLWRHDIGEHFLQWLSGRLPDSPETPLLPAETWDQYLALLEEDRCRAYGFAVEAMENLPLLELLYAVDYVTARWRHYRQRMALLLEFLRSQGVEVVVVTATWETLVRHALLQMAIDAPVLGIESGHRYVGGVGVVLDGRLEQPVTCMEGKVDALRKHLDCRPTLAIGDSLGDLRMMEDASHRIVVRHRRDPVNDLVRIARERRWPVEVF